MFCSFSCVSTCHRGDSYLAFSSIKKYPLFSSLNKYPILLITCSHDGDGVRHSQCVLECHCSFWFWRRLFHRRLTSTLYYFFATIYYLYSDYYYDFYDHHLYDFYFNFYIVVVIIIIIIVIVYTSNIPHIIDSVILHRNLRSSSTSSCGYSPRYLFILEYNFLACSTLTLLDNRLILLPSH